MCEALLFLRGRLSAVCGQMLLPFSPDEFGELVRILWIRRLGSRLCRRGVLHAGAALMSIGVAYGAARLDSAQPRRTLYLLVDESGTMKADRAGWRKDAAAVLAYSLGDGSAMTITGFGDASRKPNLALEYLDPSERGWAARNRLAETGGRLRDDDRETDIYGILQAVLVEIGRMDPTVRRLAPPAIIVLSDFHPDPAPSEMTKRQVCESLRSADAELFTVGFGNVDRATQQYLSACAGQPAWGRALNPQALLAVFWRIQRKLTSSLVVLHKEIHQPERVAVPLPEWAEELFILASQEDVARTSPDWRWELPEELQSAGGRSFRIARVRMSPELRRRGKLDIRFEGGGAISLSAAARGRINISLATVPQAPWISGEDVAIEARLRSGKTAVTEWTETSRSQYAAVLRTDAGTELPLTYDMTSGSFKTSFTVPPKTALNGDVSVSIDGATWSERLTGDVLSFPLDLPLDGAGRLLVKTWSPGVTVAVPLRSRLAARQFVVTAELRGAIGRSPQEFRFNAGALKGQIELTDYSHEPKSGGWLDALRSWLQSAPPVVGSVKLSVSTERGQRIAVDQEIPVVITFRPLWLRIALLLGLGGAFGYLLLLALRGRRLPAWHLVRYDEKGKRIALADPIPLARYRGTLNLSRYGLDGARIVSTWSGQTRVVLSGTTKLRAAAGIELARGAKYPIGIGDSLICSAPVFCAYRIEKF